MSKFLFEQEFEIQASSKIIFPYLATLSGLEQWLAESATIGANNVLDFTWDGEHHFALKTSEKRDKSVKYEFLDQNKEQESNPNTLEFSLSKNEFTGYLYLKVLDYSEEEDVDELNDLWEQIISELKDIVGG